VARPTRLLLTGAAAFVGFLAGGIGGCNHAMSQRDVPRHLAEFYPLPHHVPKYPAGLTFRFAMAHDVIHERYPKHGPAYLRERERLTRAKLARLDPNSSDALSATDDLAAAVFRLGRADEAITLMRDKLARQRRLKIEGKALYTSYANLGTFLTEANFTRAASGDTKAREQFREGVELVRKAMAVNPEAHFGRETWQAAYGELLVAAMADTSRLKSADFVGNRLTRTDLVPGEHSWSERDYGRANKMHLLRHRLSDLYRPDVNADDPALWSVLHPARENIVQVGAEAGEYLSRETGVPFDEPALGIVGMWRQGSGANPHLALALGEIMLRVGQRFIAWTAFERAARLAEKFWPDPVVQQALRDHCRQRQAELEAAMRGPEGRVLPDEVAGLRARFEAELAHGEQFQRDYQDYETATIAAGASIDDDHFYDAFNAGREPIATAPGPEEWFASVSEMARAKYAAKQFFAWGSLGAGVLAMGVALLLRTLERRVASQVY
jgi:hypothetical protein